jgi:hypothetical protein
MSKLTRENAILTFPTTEDLRSRIGEAVSLSLPQNIPTIEPLAEVGATPFGIVIHADADQASVVPLAGGLAGTVKLKLQTAAYAGNELYVDSTGNTHGFADAVEENPSGKYLCAVALESGVAGEQIEAILFRPVLAP